MHTVSTAVSSVHSPFSLPQRMHQTLVCIGDQQVDRMLEISKLLA